MSTEKVAVVTGSNKGIGYAIVKGLCEKFEGIVYLTSRDVVRGEEAITKLKQLGLNPKFHQLDVTDEASINKFKDHLKTNYGGLDLLINNAAIRYDPNTSTVPILEQAEKTLQVNYYGIVNVCDALFPLLRNNAKVIHLSSSAGHLSRIPSAEVRAKFKKPDITLEELNQLLEEFKKDAKENKLEENGWGNYVYAVSKVAVTVLTFIQQRQFDKEEPNKNISVNCVHPGYVKTDINDHQGTWTIDEGAKAPLWLALEAEIKGKYVWSNSKVVPWDSEAPPSKH